MVVQRHLFFDDLMDLKLILAESISHEALLSILSSIYKSSRGTSNGPVKKKKKSTRM